MPIEFSCTSCHKLLRVPDGSQGKQSQCPSCGAVATIPSPNLRAQAAGPADDGRVSVRCPQCQYMLRCKPELIGTKGQCKQCKHIFIIGQAGSQSQRTADLVFSCPKCQQLFDGKADMEGRKGKCHACGEVFTIHLRIVNLQQPVNQFSIRQEPANKNPPGPAINSPATKASPTDSIQIACGACSGLMAVPKTAAGHTIACPHCQQQLQIPEPQNSSRTKPSVFDQAESEIFTNLEIPTSSSNYQLDATSSYPFPSLPPPEAFTQFPNPAATYRTSPQPSSGGSALDIFNFGGTANPGQPYSANFPAASYGASASSATNNYLRHAESELRQEHSRASSNTSSALRTAQVILILVGVLTIVLNGFLFIRSAAEVDAVIRGGDAAIDRESLLLYVRVIYGAFIGLGLALIILGLLVYAYPVFCPVAGLVLYVIGIAVTGVLDPASLIKGIVFKVLIIVALIKAVKDGASYRK